MLTIKISGFNTTPSIRIPAFKQSRNISNTQIPVQDEFVRSTGTLDIARLKNLDISHFRLIDSNSVRGVTLANQRQSILAELKECGVDTVIDLRPEGGEDSKYAKACKRNGLNYFNLKIRDNMPIFNSPFAGKMPMKERKDAINSYIHQMDTFFKLMDNGKIFMACLLGLHRTDLAVTMNYLLNPNEPTTPPTLSHMFFAEETNLTNKYIGNVKNMLRNLTSSNREFLHMPQNFSDIFDARVMKLRMMNKAK